MPTQKLPVKYRISKGTRARMIGVAFLFDLLPLLLLLGTIAFMFYQVTSVSNLCSESIEKMRPYLQVAGPIGAAVLQVVGCGATAAALGITAVLSWIILAPTLFAIFSFVATVLSGAFFTLWFARHHVYIISIRPGRFFTNLAMFLIEFIPFINLLPGITIGVSVHIALARATDKQRHLDKVMHVQKKVLQTSQRQQVYDSSLAITS